MMNLKRLVSNDFGIAVLTLTVTLGSHSANAQSTTALSGTYGCLLNTNFSGFNT
jgi:hypothetical protein